jgi:hypothetical protein
MQFGGIQCCTVPLGYAIHVALQIVASLKLCYWIQNVDTHVSMDLLMPWADVMLML